MKTLILYFSGTGNTDFIAEELKLFLQEMNVDVTAKSYEQFKNLDASAYDFLVIGSPVYAFVIPPFFRDFVLSLTYKKSASVFLFTTMALYEGIAQVSLGRKLRQKGLKVAGGKSIKMPGSDGMGMLKNDSSYLKKILNKDFKNLDSLNELKKSVFTSISTRTHDEKSVFNNRILRATANVAMGFFYHMGESILRKLRVREDACTHCLKCLCNCPASNINHENKTIEFGSTCYLCLRCFHQCPEHAIEIGGYTLGRFRYMGPMNDFWPRKYFV